jgi:hydroxyacylglutathione hydrolase
VFFKQFYLESLGHASYLIGDESTGRALVLDPRRDVDEYYEEARRNGLRISYTIDTHGHNDYLSGITELRARQDVEALAFTEADVGYDHRPVKDAEIVEMGDVAFEIVHTPGHTPEHVSLLVYDRHTGEEPVMLLSGGSLLVGDLGRPDLLGGEDSAREMAIAFCHTIQEKILFHLPDHLEVYPTHVSGSLCGGNIGSRLSTTLGYERKTNAILVRVASSEEFVEECIRLDNLPAVPPYWRRMRKQNLAGVASLGVLEEPPALHTPDFEDAMRDSLVLDCRQPDAFASGFIPGALNVGLGPSFSTWAGTVLPDRARVLLVLDSPGDLWDATWQLLRIGYDLPVGWLAGGMNAWRNSARPIAMMPYMTVEELRSRLTEGGLRVLDVRQPAEWTARHIAGADFITAAELPERASEVERVPTAVICGGGYRSSVAASLLAKQGHDQVAVVVGGMGAWNAAGYATEAD